jgi:hypothetical protein
MSSLSSREQDSGETFLSVPSRCKYSWETPMNETDFHPASLSSIEITKKTQASSGIELRAYNAQGEELSVQWSGLGLEVEPKNEEQDRKSQEVPLYVPEGTQKERSEHQLSVSDIGPAEFSLHDSLKPALSRETHEEAMKRRLGFVERRMARIMNDLDAVVVEGIKDAVELSARQKQRQVIHAALELSEIVAELKEIDKLSDHESTQLIQRALVLHAVEALEELHAVHPGDKATVQKEFYETLGSGHEEATRSLVWKG